MDKILQIRKYPDAILRRVCLPVKQMNHQQLRLFDNMLDAMRHYSGIGLAAPQVGIEQSLFVADIGQGAIKLANPEVMKVKGRDSMEEGCLSVPNTLVKVVRPDEIVVRGLNEKGKIVEIRAKGLLARVILHEIDHLNGKLIVDYMNLLNRLKFKFKAK